MRKFLVLAICSVALVGCQKAAIEAKTASGETIKPTSAIAMAGECAIYRTTVEDENGAKTTVYTTQSTNSLTCSIAVK